MLDARTGEAIHQVQVEPGGSLGGLFADTAVSHGVVYANGINWPGGFGTPPVAGDLIAIAGDGSRELWRFTTPHSPNLSCVATAAGVVPDASTVGNATASPRSSRAVSIGVLPAALEFLGCASVMCAACGLTVLDDKTQRRSA